MQGVEAGRSLARPEMAALLQRGKASLLAAMSPLPRILQRADILVQMGEAPEFIYAVETGWLARARSTPDGRRQIMVVFLPGEFCGIKTMFMTRQSDAIEALTAASDRRLHYPKGCR